MAKGKNKKKPKNKNSRRAVLLYIVRNILVFFFVFILIAIFATNTLDEKKKSEDINISGLVSQIQQGGVAGIVVRGNTVEVTYKDESIKKTKKEPQTSFVETLQSYGVTPFTLSTIDYEVKRESGFGYWARALLPFLFPILLLVILAWFFLRQTKGGMQAFTFGKSSARYIDPNNTANRVLFEDVAGAKEAKEELHEFVDFLKKPERYIHVGAKVPKGVLLTGAPGTGKTLLARAVAGEAKVPFFSISGSEFVEMFVGVGASRVRDLFRNAKKLSPSIIFIDEIDAVGRMRGSGMGGGNDEREQALNQILVEMDGFEPADKVVIIAATNRPDVLDTALLRPGRFDRKVVIDLPDMKERESILKVHSKGKRLSSVVNLGNVAKRTPGFSGADLASVVNEAAISVVRQRKDAMEQNDLYLAIEKVMLGPERKSHILSDLEKKVTAYHEAGHALLASVLPYADPVQKISIISRGHAAGYVLSLPDSDRKLQTKQEFVDSITMALGGYATEQLLFGDVSTGPSSDIAKITEMATNMVTRWGMSSKLGPISLRRREAGNTREEHSDLVEKTIDEEVSDIIKSAYDNATVLLKKHRTALDGIAKKLLEVETLEREEYEALLVEHGVEIQNALGK